MMTYILLCVVATLSLFVGYALGKRNRVHKEWLGLAIELARKHEAVISQAKPIVGKAIQVANAAKMDSDVAHFRSVHNCMCRAIGMAGKMEVMLG